MVKKFIIAAIIGLGILVVARWAASTLGWFATDEDRTAAAQQKQLQVSMERVHQATQKAEQLTREQVLSYYSLAKGAELGTFMAGVYEGLQIKDLDRELIRQGLQDGLRNTIADEFQGKGEEYQLAGQRALCNKIGAPMKMPQELTPEQKKHAEELEKLATAIPQDAALRLLNYSLGFLIGQDVFNRNLPLCQETDVYPEHFFEGLDAGLRKQIPAELTQEENAMAYALAFTWLVDQRMAEIGKMNKEAGEAYLKQNATAEGVVCLPSGVQYKVLTPGAGEIYSKEKFGDNPTCEVTYEGRLVNGSLFDSTGGTSVSFPLQGVVPGFAEALKLMPQGAEWEVSIPADQAYGDAAPAQLGPNATLIFKLKLITLRPTQKN